MTHRLKILGSLLWTAIAGYQRHNVNRLAASMAFYAILSLAPLAVIVVTVSGFVFGQQAAEGLIVKQLESTLGQTAAKAVQDVIGAASTSRASIPATIVAALVLIWSASRLIGDARSSLNTIWEVQGRGGGGFRGFFIGKAIDIAMIFGLAVLLLVAIGANTAVNAITHYFTSLVGMSDTLLSLSGIVFSLVVAVVLLGVIFRVLPNIHIGWKDITLGAVLSGVFFTIGNYFLGFYLARKSPGSIFGAVGSFVVVMVWLYYSSITVLFGVEISRAYWERQRDRGKRKRLEPKKPPDEAPVLPAHPHPPAADGPPEPSPAPPVRPTLVQPAAPAPPAETALPEARQPLPPTLLSDQPLPERLPAGRTGTWRWVVSGLLGVAAGLLVAEAGRRGGRASPDKRPADDQAGSK